MRSLAALPVAALVVVSACSSSGDGSGGASSSSSSSSGGSSTSSSSSSSSGATPPPPTNAVDGPAAGNPDGKCPVPADAQPEDVSNPTTVVGTGTPASCTGDAFVAAVAKGGVITFDCGPAPATIVLTQTAKVFNDKGPKIVIDGGGKVTLSGGGKVRILYMNTCDQKQVWTSPDCNNQTTPDLTVQNLTFVDGNAKGLETGDNDGGGGAIYVRGGKFKILKSRFFQNVCDDLGSDVGGGAVRVLSNITGGSIARPVYVVDSTFGGKTGYGNTCANGGALSSIGTSWTIVNSLFSDNHAIGHGANSGQGGNGGGIYNDGNTFDTNLCGTLMEDNHANEGGSAIFFVSNDKTGTLRIQDSTLRNNPKGTFETQPGLFVQAKSPPVVTNSTIR
jgi:hypothetical protein